MTASISSRDTVKPNPTLNNRPRSGEGAMGGLLAPEGYDVIDCQFDADFFADGVIVV